jgi:hypothetical protein
LIGGRHHRETRARSETNAGGDVHAFVIRWHGHERQARGLERRARRDIAGLLGPDEVAGLCQRARGEVDALLRAGDDDDLLRLADDAARGAEIFGDGLAQLGHALRVAVAQRVLRALAMQARGDACPVAPGKMIEAGNADRERQHFERTRRHLQRPVVA